MGAILVVSAHISDLEKQTIINTRVNKTRGMIGKFDIEPSLHTNHRCDTFEYAEEGQQSVGFHSIVHERFYLNQDAPSESIVQDKKTTLKSRVSRSCDRESRTSSRKSGKIKIYL